MIRSHYFSQIAEAFQVTPIVALLGPRQSGKTTLARQYSANFSPEEVHFFDLEDPRDLQRLQNPLLTLQDLSGLIVLDEIQRLPEFFPLLRVLVDNPENRSRFLLLGSASRDLLRQSSESLAGRILYLEVQPFGLEEVGEEKKLWFRGGFPRSFLAESDALSTLWREGYLRTFLERDIPQLGIQIPAASLRRFWQMLAHYHGQIFQASELGKSLRISETTVHRYLDVLTGTFMIRALQPWYENIAKRQVKRPKIYFRDSGILHQLSNIPDPPALQVHPMLGRSWEGFALEEILRRHRAAEGEAYFWAVHSQMELDLLVIKDGKRLGYEIKHADVPKIAPVHRKIISLLRLDQLSFVVPVDCDYFVEDGLRVVGLNRLQL